MKDGSKAVELVEQGITRRIGDVRRFHRISQSELARRAGITRNQLANVESMRVPLKFWLGWKLCELLNINPVYIFAGGLPSPFRKFDLSRHMEQISKTALFSDVMPRIEAEIDAAALIKMAGGESQFRKVASSMVDAFCERVPKERQLQFLAVLMETLETFLRKKS